MNIKKLVPAILLLVLLGCSKSGIQGTNLFSSFVGLEKAEPVSPTAIKLTWTLDSKYISYNVYVNNAVSPTKKETFSTTLISALEAKKSYSFNVTGVGTGSSETAVGGTLTATTLDSFAGLTTGGVVLKSSSDVNLTWNMNSLNATYKIFYKKQTGTWDLTKPVASVTGNNTNLVTGLTAGEVYCFFIQAVYKDDTVEPLAATESAINAVAPCVRLTSSMENLPSISVNSTVPGPFAWFWTANGDSTYTTDIFELDTDLRVASRIGNGTFRSFVKEPEGTKNYYAIVSKGSQVARLAVDLSGKATKTSTKLRSINASGDKGPIFPALMNGGYGSQNFGSKVISGDFNCDGLRDLAIALPNAVLEPTQQHYIDTGAVIVYYSYRPPGPCFDSNGDQLASCPVQFKTDGVPSATNVFPNPTLITYPALGNQMRLGKSLAVGNFNGDCYNRNSAVKAGGSCQQLFYNTTQVPALASTRPNIKSCDDLVIGTNLDTFYVVYGDPVKGLITGSGAATSGVDEFTCDSFSNACRVVRMTKPAAYTTGTFGNAFAVGDYNNDGFDELAVPARQTATGVADILIYRGSGQGLYPQGTSGGHAKIDASVYNVSTNPTGSMIGTSIGGAIASTDGFGSSLGTAFNSRRCVNGTPTGYVYQSPMIPDAKGFDFTKCDDLMIGSPNRAADRGSVFSCKADMATGSSVITKWSCAEHYPTGLAAGSLYGSAILGVRNQNAYPVNALSGSGTTPNIAGAVFVGAPNETINGLTQAGSVYGYYIPPSVASDANSFTLGGITRVMGLLNHDVNAVNSVACDRYNGNVSDSGFKRCDHQKITMPQPESYAHFGTNINSIPQKSSDVPAEESMRMLAIAAPDRTVLKSDGSGSIGSAGAVYMFRPDLSTFGTDPVGGTVTAPNYNSTCPLSTGCETNTKGTWYSGGVSPFGPSVFYPNDLKPSAHFGSGGVAAGNFNGDDTEETDVVISAPDLDTPTPKNGAAYFFYSNDGFAPAENSPSKTLQVSLGLEGGYRFEEAKIVGDINGDGYDDLVGHINANGTWKLVVYYGSANGIIQTPKPSATATGNQPLLITVASDASFAQNFFPAGDVNGDGFADIFATGSKGSYIFYGSSAGLVASQTPAVAPIGKGPLLFAAPGTIYNLSFENMNTYSTAAPTDTSYNTSLGGLTYGDFNSDGYGDIAIRIPSVRSPDATLGGVAGSGLNYNSNQTGRVVIIYGSATGPQVNRITGKITISATSASNDVVAVDPCSLDILNVATCKVQMVGTPSATATSQYAFALATSKTKANSQYHANYDRLLVSDTTGVGVVYMFEGSLSGLKTSVVQTLVGPSDAAGFGLQIVNAGDINGDFYDDLIVSDRNRIYAFYGSKDTGGIVSYYGDSNNLSSGTDYWNTTPSTIQLNADNPGLNSPRPQKIRPVTMASKDLFGWGLAAVGDFNNDGFNDVIVNVPNGDNNLSGTITNAGNAIIFFGTEKGLKIESVSPTPYPRCYGGATVLCEPFQLFVPDAVAYENTTVNPYSVGDVNGDGYKDIVIGVAGRDLVTPGLRSATSTGALYILY